MDFSDDNSGGGNGGGSGFPGTGTSGTGGSGGGWNDNPCRSIGAAGGSNPCDGSSTPGWQPIGEGSQVLGYLITQLDLSSVQIAWLQNHQAMQTELYNYLQGSADLQAAAATASLHLMTMMNDAAYLQFVSGHQTTGVVGTVWWLNEPWISNPTNFWLGLTETQEQQPLTPAEKTLIAVFPIQALKIQRNIDPSFLEQANHFPSGGINDKADAFRHAYFNALNTRDCPPSLYPPLTAGQIVHLFGIAHESETPSQLQLEKQMDLFNNEVGITYCLTCFPGVSSSSNISNGIMTLLNNGDLRYLKPINLSDPYFNGTSSVPATHGITSATVLTPTNQ